MSTAGIRVPFGFSIGMRTGLRLGSKAADPFVVRVVVAAGSVVPCRGDASSGAIRAGALLGASPTPGHAMRVANAAPRTIVGEALRGFDRETGTIRVLAMSP